MLHYGFLIAAIFAVVLVVDTFVMDVSVWLGVAIAAIVGLGYPMVLKRVGLEPA